MSQGFPRDRGDSENENQCNLRKYLFESKIFRKWRFLGRSFNESEWDKKYIYDLRGLENDVVY